MLVMLLLLKIFAVLGSQEFEKNNRLQYDKFLTTYHAYKKQEMKHTDCEWGRYNNKASLEAMGWALSGFTIHDWEGDRCPKYSWLGRGQDEAAVSKTLTGSGFGLLQFNNCGKDGSSTSVYLDGVEITSAQQFLNDVLVYFEYTDGQVLELKGGNGNDAISFSYLATCVPPKTVEKCTDSQNQQLRELLSDPVICFDDPDVATENGIYLCECVQSVPMTALAPFDCTTDEGLIRGVSAAKVMVSSLHHLCAKRKIGVEEIDAPGWQVTPAIKMYHYSSIPPVTLEYGHDQRFYKCMEICESDPRCKMFTVEKRGKKCIFNYCNSEKSCAAEQPGSHWVSGLSYGEAFSYVKSDKQNQALRTCTEHCKQNHCQRSGNFLESCHGQMSCTQACYVRHYGSTKQKCLEQCDKFSCGPLAKSSGNAFRFENCKACDNSCLPTKQQCRAGCSNYVTRRALTEKDSSELSAELTTKRKM